MPFNYPRLLHLYWDGSPLSYLNYLTIVSFNRLHKGWKINIYMPSKRTTVKTWTGFENKVPYSGRCYLLEAKKIPNVTVHSISLDAIGFDNNASEVIKSDYFRYYILSSQGGLWSDFDILYTDNVERLLNYTEDAIIFQSSASKYFPVALFLAKPNNKFFKYILSVAKSYYNPLQYQCLGVLMFNSLFNNTTLLTDRNKVGSVRVCNHKMYLPFEWNQVTEIFKKNRPEIRGIIGVHWFNGTAEAKQYMAELEARKSEVKFVSKCHMDNIIAKYMV